MLAYMLTTFKYKGTLSIYATTLIFTPWLLPVAVNMDEHSIPAKKKNKRKVHPPLLTSTGQLLSFYLSTCIHITTLILHILKREELGDHTHMLLGSYH
jgi:hypothetical protein